MFNYFMFVSFEFIKTKIMYFLPLTMIHLSTFKSEFMYKNITKYIYSIL